MVKAVPRRQAGVALRSLLLLVGALQGWFAVLDGVARALDRV